MKHLKQYEEYRGPHKAIGFKHYSSQTFAFILETSEENLDDFLELNKNFSTYMKRLGVLYNGVINGNFILFVFDAVNQFEGFSIMEQITTWFKNKKLNINSINFIPNFDLEIPVQSQFHKSINLTSYVKRKEYISKLAGSKTASFMTQAYKDSKIGF